MLEWLSVQLNFCGHLDDCPKSFATAVNRLGTEFQFGTILAGNQFEIVKERARCRHRHPISQQLTETKASFSLQPASEASLLYSLQRCKCSISWLPSASVRVRNFRRDGDLQTEPMQDNGETEDWERTSLELQKMAQALVQSLTGHSQQPLCKCIQTLKTKLATSVRFSLG